jgi:uncharacterized protein
MRRTVFLLTVLTVLAGFALPASAQCNENCPQRRTISVTGTAQVTADADLAIVRVGYKLYAPDAKTAYANALDTSNAIMRSLTASGVPRSDIESTSQVLEHTQPYELQQYPWSNDERKERQFTTTQSWTIRVKPDEAAGALNTAINAGANESGWIQWIVNDPSALQARASADATTNAHAIAEQIAQKSGVRLGQLVTVSQNQTGPFMGAIGNIAGGGFGMGTAMSFAGAPQPNGQELAINSRRVEYTVSVYAVYSIE